MKINSVNLNVLAVRRSQYPTDNKPEFLLVGRSNVGKSSFINTMINRKNYAKTSSNPGKTQTINFYLVNDEFYLVDAPGYGYANLSKERQKKFGLMMEDYLTSRENLKHVFMLVDFRNKPSKDDVMMYNFLKHYKIPVTIIATKTDKVGITQHIKHRNMILKELDLVVGDDFVMFSSITKQGKEEISKKILRTIQFFFSYKLNDDLNIINTKFYIELEDIEKDFFLYNNKMYKEINNIKDYDMGKIEFKIKVMSIIQENVSNFFKH